MKRFPLFLATLLATGAAQADGLNLGVGVDYSSGEYGTDTTTTILSVPLTAKYATGAWIFKASVPWMRIEGDPNVVPGLGSVTNLNPVGRGRGRGAPGGAPGGEPVTDAGGTASGVGDVRLAATYAFDTGSALGLDLTANVKLATADEDKGLGTGANDYGLAVDVYRNVAGAVLFGGVGYTVLGDSAYIDVDSVLNANAGASWTVRGGSVGAFYDWREAASATADARSELTGFYSVPAGDRAKLQFYAVKGISDGSPDWGAGVSLSADF